SAHTVESRDRHRNKILRAGATGGDAFAVDGCGLHENRCAAGEQRINSNARVVKEVQLYGGGNRGAVFGHQFEFHQLEFGCVEVAIIAEVEVAGLFGTKVFGRALEQQFYAHLQFDGTAVGQEPDEIGVKQGIGDAVHFVNEARGLR